MALTVQNLRAVGPGTEPASLLPGQIAFNITDKTLYVGDGSSFKTSFDGTQAPGVAGGGWYAMPMDFASLGDYYVANPGYWGDVPTDQQVLTWSTALNHPIWTSGGGGGGGNQVYVVTNAAVAAAPGATTSAKITAAIGVVSPDEGDVTIVTGIPDDVYEGLYFFTTEWVKGAAYAYPSASEVIYDNTVTGLTPTVQGAIDDLDAGLAATTAIANTANSTANSALSIANAALPKAGGTMTGTIVARNINVQSGYSVQFDGGIAGTLNGISDSVSSGSSNTAASSAAVRSAYLLAQAALPRAGGTMTGAITFAAGQVFPISGIQIATTGQLGVVQVGTNIDVAAGVISVPAATGASNGVVTVGNNIDVLSGTISVKTATATDLGLVKTGTHIQNTAGTISILDSTTAQQGVVQLVDSTVSTAVNQALTANQGRLLQNQINSLTISGGVTLAGGFDPNTPAMDSVTTLGGAAGFTLGADLPSPAPGNDNYYVIVIADDLSYSPPGGGGPYSLVNGDWLLSDGVTWTYLGVGSRPPTASYTTVGVVQLADPAVTLAGLSQAEAVTPDSLQQKMNDNVNITNSFCIASSTAVKTAYDIGAAAIPCSVITAVGNIVVGGAGPSPTALPVGTNGQVLVANSACATGLEWVTDVPGDVTSVTGTAPITVDNTDSQNPIVGVDLATTTTTGVVSVGSNLTVDLAGEINVDTASTSVAGIVQLDDTVTSTSTTQAATANALKGVYDIASAAVPRASFLAKGNLLAATGAGVYSALTVGTNGQVLLANSSCTTGLEWGNADYVPDACFTAAGQLIVGTGVGTYVALSIGTSGQSLVVDLACTATGGLKWGQSLSGYTCTLTPFNTAIGANAGDSITTGVNNTSIGYNAGTAITGGLNNTFVGFDAGDGITSADNNVAVGSRALSNTGGNSNTAVGYCTGGGLTSGGQNTFIGGIAGYRATTLDNAVAVGYGAMGGATSGTGQVAVGSNALCSLTSGAGNVAVGYQTLDLVTTGANNTAVGHQAGSNVGTNVSGNTLIGNGAGCAITTGANNTLLGNYTGTTTLTNNIVLSDGAGTIRFQSNANGAWSYDGTNFGTVGQVLASNGTAATPTWCTLSLACVPCSAFTGSGQLLTGTGTSTFTALPTGTNGQVLSVDTACTGGLKWFTPNTLCGYTNTAAPLNTALGFQAGDSITSGTDNVTIGYNAGTAITTGSQNVVIGSNTSVSSNAVGIVAVGFCAGQAVTTGGCVTHIGWVSGRNSTGASNTYVGALTGCAASNTSACGTLLGFCAGSALTTGNGNNFIGFQAGRNVNTGGFNVAIGTAAFQTATTAANNVAVGCGALSGLSTTCGNVAIGHRAMLNASTAANNVVIGCVAGEQISTGSNNTFVGDSAGDVATTGSNNTALGSNALGAVTIVSNLVAVGSAALQGNTTGTQNTAVGTSALSTSTSASNNTALGYRAGTAISGGGNNTIVGTNAGASINNGSSNTIVGNNSGVVITSGSCNTLVGNSSGSAITTGACNTLVGGYTGTTTLSNNVVLSDGAGNIKLQVNENGAVGVGTTPSYGTSGQILVSGGSGAAPTWSTSASVPANYGSFLRTTTQTNLDTTNGQAAIFDTTVASNNFSVVSGTQITAAVAGTYSIVATYQVSKTNAGTDDVNVWFKKNGVNVPNSAFNLTLVGNNAAQLATTPWIITLAAGDQIEAWWWSADANAIMLGEPAAAPYPAIPSVNLVIMPVGA